MVASIMSSCGVLITESTMDQWQGLEVELNAAFYLESSFAVMASEAGFVVDTVIGG